jgi:glycosyltransferase involved in cell wall biosynthesis
LKVTNVVPGPGRPADAARIQQAVAVTPGAVLVEPAHSPAGMAAMYASARVVVVPGRAEPFGMVSLEARVAGAPVVAYDDAGLKEAPSASLRLVAPGDGEALARAIVQAWEGPRPSQAEREELASRFSLANSTGALVRLLEKAATGAHGHSLAA